jgi:predicted O-methyltransferase YrrM
MDRKTLEKQREKLLEELKVINKQLGIRSHIAIEEIRDKVKEFCPEYDLIFIDGDHSYEGVRRDFELYQELLSPRGYIVFHDIDPDHTFRDGAGGQVYKFWQDISHGSKTNIVTMKSSGKTTCFGQKEHFGGIGIWKP